MIRAAVLLVLVAAAAPQPEQPAGTAAKKAPPGQPAATGSATPPSKTPGAAPAAPAAGTPGAAPGAAAGGAAEAPADAPPSPPARIPIQPERPLNPALSRQCFAPNAITTRDYEAARVAWRYFERNFQPKTGFVNAVDGYPSTTMWDLGSSLIGTIAARELELIDQKTFDDRIEPLLRTLGRLRLFNDEMPNKAYDARSGEMSDYANKPSASGIGFSAIDIARIVSSLELLTCLHPRYAPAVERIVLRWRWCRILQPDGMYGVHVVGGGKPPTPGQEGRIGYEQYAAKGLQMLGFQVGPLASYSNKNATDTVIYGVPIRHDSRDPKKFGALNYVVTESYALDAMEFGRGEEVGELVKRIYEVQRRRWQETGKVTAVSEDHVDEPPHFVYNTIYVSGEAWKATTDKGEDVARLKSVSTKAAFSLAALFPDDPYSAVLLDAVSSAYDPERGWYSGVYENGGYNRSVTSNTNGIVLQTVLFKLYGALHPRCAACSRRLQVDASLLTREQASVSCFPGTRPAAAGPGGQAPAGGAGGVGAGAAPPAGPGPARTGPGLPPPAPAGPAPSTTPPQKAPTRGAAPVERDGDDAALAGIAPPQSGVLAPIPARPGRSRYGVAGNVFGTYREVGTATVGTTGRVSRGPVFARLGASWRVAETRAEESLSRFGWSWGVGYDDWRPRTFSVQLNNWGPILPGEGGAWRSSVFDVGYKLPRWCSGKLCLSSVTSVSVPVAGGPSAGWRANVSFLGSWFVMAGASVAIPEIFPADDPVRRVRFVYGIGRFDWRAARPFLTFYNWGPEPGLREGVAMLGVNWAL